MPLPMRETERRRLLERTRNRVIPEAAAKIHTLLDKRFKVIKRQLRAAHLKKRNDRLMGRDGLVKADDLNWQEWEDQFEEELTDALTFVVGGIWDAETKYWKTRKANPSPVSAQDIINAYQRRTGKQIKQVADDTEAWTMETIQEWYRTDESLPELIARLEPFFDEARATTIARTETSFISSEVSSTMYNQFGVQYFNVDRDPRLGPACEEHCQPMIDTNPHPIGDPMPPYHPNCWDGTVPADEDGNEFIFGADLD